MGYPFFNGGCAACAAYKPKVGDNKHRCFSPELARSEITFNPVLGALGGSCEKLNLNGDCPHFVSGEHSTKRAESPGVIICRDGDTLTLRYTFNEVQIIGGNDEEIMLSGEVPIAPYDGPPVDPAHPPTMIIQSTRGSIVIPPTGNVIFPSQWRQPDGFVLSPDEFIGVSWLDKHQVWYIYQWSTMSAREITAKPVIE